MKKVKLETLCELKNGLNFAQKDSVSGCKIIGVSNFGDKYFAEYDNLAEVDSSIVNKEELLEDNDILFVRSNGNKNLVGRAMLIRNPPSLLSFSGFCIRLRVTSKDVNPLYLFYYFKNPSIRRQFRKSQQTNISNLSQDLLNDINVFLPELNIQKDICSVLDNISRKIELNNKINAELESMAKTIYDYWFTQFDFPDENGRPYKSSGGKMEWNEELQREIPAGWEVKRVKELLPVITGKEDANFSSINGKYPFFTCSTETLLCDKPAFNGTAILVTGNGDFSVKHFTGAFNAYQRTYVLIPENPIFYASIYIAAKKNIEKFKNGSNGSIIKFITKGDVENITIFEPHNDSLLQQLNHILLKIEKTQKESEELISIRNWLLPMLMNGQIVINKDSKISE